MGKKSHLCFTVNLGRGGKKENLHFKTLSASVYSGKIYFQRLENQTPVKNN